MKTKEELFEMDWSRSGIKLDLEHRLKQIGYNPEDNQEEVNSLLDRLNKEKEKLKRFYKVV